MEKPHIRIAAAVGGILVLLTALFYPAECVIFVLKDSKTTDMTTVLDKRYVLKPIWNGDMQGGLPVTPFFSVNSRSDLPKNELAALELMSYGRDPVGWVWLVQLGLALGCAALAGWLTFAMREEK